MGVKRTKWLKKLFCKHKRTHWIRCDLVPLPGPGGHWKTQHTWQCNECGKEIKSKEAIVNHED